MTSGDVWLLVAAAALVVLAGLFSAADAALGVVLPRPRRGARGRGPARARRRLVALLEDPPRYLNTALLLRLLCEISAIVLVAVQIARARTTAPGGRPC